MRAVIYARYSSDQQRAALIKDQVRLCRERINREGWSLVQTFADRAKSGATLLRPSMQGLLAGAMAAEYDVIVAEALDRLSRDQADVAAVFKRLQFAGVPIITLAEGEITDLHVGLKGTMNALFLKDLADKTRRGLRGRVEAGASGGGLCYGYDVVSGPAGGGRGRRRINEAEAAVVRRIFRDFANGLSPKRIALALNGESVSGPSGSAWSPSTIYGNHERGTGILNNELYIGRLVWNRLRYLKDPNAGKRVSRLNAPDLWVVSEVPDLRVVDQDLWDAVKRRQASVRTAGADTGKATAVALWDRRRPRYLFSGLMVCGCCGGGYSKISANLFGCSTARNKGPTACTSLLNIRRDVLEETVLAGLRERLLDPTLFKVFAEEFTTAANRQRRDESRRIDDLRAEEASIARRIAKLVSAIADGLPARSVRDELMRLEARQDELAALIAAAPEAPPPLLHPNLPEVYRRKVAHLHTLLEHPDTKVEAMDLVRSLVEAIILTPENGTLRVDLRGELAAIFGLCADSKKPGAVSGAGLLEQVKMVAGAGFEPATFRL